MAGWRSKLHFWSKAQGLAAYLPWKNCRNCLLRQSGVVKVIGKLCKAKPELQLLCTKGLRRESVISFPSRTPNRSFSLLELSYKVFCHHLWSARSVLLRDGSGVPVSPMEEQELRGTSHEPCAGDIQIAGAPLLMPDMLQGPCDGGLKSPLDSWFSIAGVTKSTLPLIDWILVKEHSSVAYHIFS